MDWRDYYTRMALKVAPALITIVTFIAIVLGVIFHAISIDEFKFSEHKGQHFEPDVIIGDKPTDLVWFLQVTDLHLSIREQFERQTDFREFTKDYVNIIKPDVVLITGDITDGRCPNETLKTGQQLDEWKAYYQAIVDSGNLNKTTWLDIRGNHDNFNVYRPRDPKTLFRQYSIQGRLYPRNYMHILEKGGKKYSFIGVDEVQTPGVKLFNFIGIVKEDDVEALKEFKELSRKEKSQSNVWFAHYPTSSIASTSEDLRDIVDGPYLCGHFHTIGNLVTHMHSTQQSGFAEVELGDWKHNRLIRLAAIDHQLFSFVDVKFRQFPIALMTNPKTAKYAMPKYEPVERIINSTHIRVLAFSNVSLSRVEISIDGESKNELVHSDGPLYVLKWNPAQYAKGLHSAEVTVSDIEGKVMTYNQSFSVDGSKDEFQFFSRVLIRGNFRTYLMSIYFFIVVICTLPMLCLKLIDHQPNQESSMRKHYRGTFLFNLHLLSKINSLFWPLFLIPLWLTIMPNFIGYMVDDVIGACFVWGILVDNTYIHTGLTYNVAAIFLLLIHVPITIIFVGQVSDNYRSTLQLNSSASIINVKFIIHLALTALQLSMGYLIYNAIGTMAYFTSFPFFWCLLIYSFCWYQCTLINRSNFVNFDYSNGNNEERQAFTSYKTRDDKSSTSDHSTC